MSEYEEQIERKTLEYTNNIVTTIVDITTRTSQELSGNDFIRLELQVDSESYQNIFEDGVYVGTTKQINYLFLCNNNFSLKAWEGDSSNNVVVNSWGIINYKQFSCNDIIYNQLYKGVLEGNGAKYEISYIFISNSPTLEPTPNPTQEPTVYPTVQPTNIPTALTSLQTESIISTPCFNLKENKTCTREWVEFEGSGRPDLACKCDDGSIAIYANRGDKLEYIGFLGEGNYPNNCTSEE